MTEHNNGEISADSIIFDLDGTLWDSVAAVTGSWQQVVSRYPGLRGPLSDRELSQCMGLTTDEIAEAIFPQVPPQQREQLVEECFAEEHAWLRRSGGRLYHGVAETLAALSSSHDLAIVSNCELGYIECFFETTGLEKYFRDYESFGATGLPKGENIRQVMRRLPGRSAVYVGDMIKDQQAAQLAGIPFIFARYGFGQGKLQPTHWDYAISSFPELLQLFKKASR